MSIRRDVGCAHLSIIRSRFSWSARSHRSVCKQEHRHLRHESRHRDEHAEPYKPRLARSCWQRDERDTTAEHRVGEVEDGPSDASDPRHVVSVLQSTTTTNTTTTTSSSPCTTRARPRRNHWRVAGTGRINVSVSVRVPLTMGVPRTGREQRLLRCPAIVDR
jgi:hypothetical protein